MRTVLFALLLLSATLLNAADLKVTVVRHYSRVLHNRAPGDRNFRDQDWQRSEITYSHGPLRRFEFHDEHPHPTNQEHGMSAAAFIEHCAAGQLTTIDFFSREYKRSKYPTTEEFRAMAARSIAEARRNPAGSSMQARTDTKTVDTGETMQIFSRTARHFIITTRKDLPLIPGATQETTTDAWYLDADFSVPDRGCRPENLEFSAPPYTKKRHGPIPRGFLVKAKSVSQVSLRSDSSYTETLELTVTELSEAPLDPALFVPPPDFKLVSCMGFANCPK